MEKVIKDPCTQRYGITGRFWCDDFADLYVGRCAQLSESLKSHNWEGTQHTTDFDTSAGCCDYLYFACWSNDGGQNGFLAQITAGGNPTVYTNSADWEVYATGLDFDSISPRPTRASVMEQIEKANCHHYWTKPALGPKNTGTPKPYLGPVTNISPNANFIWFDSGLDSGANVPFKGFNHCEYLIFRIPVKKLVRACAECDCADCDCCDCGCDGCNEHASEQEKVLANRAKTKVNVLPGSSNVPKLCQRPYTAHSCQSALAIKKLTPCFYLHWGDSPTDQVEDDDTETLYLTVCNPYADLLFKGLRVTKLTISPTQPLSAMELVPDSLVCFDCVEPCSCKSRAFALITRKAVPQLYTIEVEYCMDSIEATINGSGKTSFQITVVKD